MSDRLLHLEKLFNELVRYPRAMLVDDVEYDLLKAEDIFRKVGFITTSVRDMETAKNMVRRGGYDLVVTDLKMDGPNGSSLVRFCWKEVPAVKLAVLTGYPDSEAIYRLIEERPITILAKPLNVDMVVGLMADFNIVSPGLYGDRIDTTIVPKRGAAEPIGHK